MKSEIAISKTDFLNLASQMAGKYNVDFNYKEFGLKIPVRDPDMKNFFTDLEDRYLVVEDHGLWEKNMKKYNLTLS
jgi:hypothetical protein